MGYPNPGPVQGYWGAGSSNPYPYQNPYAVPFDRVYPEKPRVPLQKRDMVFFALFAAATFLFMDLESHPCMSAMAANLGWNPHAWKK